MSMGMRGRMATMWTWMRRKTHPKAIINQRRMWRTDPGPSHDDVYEGEDGDDVDADEEEETSQADDGSTQNVED
jgi:hypothetical protein